MEQFFAKEYSGGAFVLYGTGHLIALTIILLICFLLSSMHSLADNKKRILLSLMGGLLLINETGWHAWNIYWGTWTIQTMLPLHLCSFTVWGSIYMLFTGNRNVYFYETLYFLGIGGATQALLTPDAGPYGFPHFRAFQTFISHGLLVIIPLYMTIVEGYRPTLASFKRVFIVTNIYMVVVFFVNLAIGSNYLFVAGKPEFPTLLDALAPWPWYIFELEAIGFAVFFLIYLPFFIKDHRTRKAVTA
ncbi:MAG: TIGR02206 family membrane protein [Chloroflexi bacterium]|nr:TIGR02206 family membrane protein [Chloroflexota bacterium]